jgi:hypothetical protein
MSNEWQYPVRAFAGVLILAGLLLAGCLNPLNPPSSIRTSDNPAGGGLVSIHIGGDESANARTVQPAALAGYRLTFSGGPAHDPVDITTGTSADVYLADGIYTITATAYKAGGTIGNSGDAVASGSVSVTLSGGAVTSNGGVVPPIILRPESGGNGTLVYTINSAAAVSGTMKIWDISGTTLVSGFGTSGVLTIGASPSISAEIYTLTTGRYIVEIRLVEVSGYIALLREVVEIWRDTSTAIVFEPTVYLDPSAVPIYSGAALSAASTIGGVTIGTGTGTGRDETNATSYYISVPDRANAAIDFVPESDSLFADISWVANTGTAPGNTGYVKNPVSNFSANYVLWVKVVSEDGSTTRYYQFKVYPLPPVDGYFGDTDIQSGKIGGDITWTPPASTSGISGYRIYFGATPDTKLPGWDTQAFPVADPSQGSWTVSSMDLPEGAHYFLVYYYISDEEGEYPLHQSIPILDATYSGSFGNFSVRGLDGADGTHVSWSNPVLTISGGSYYINSSSSSGRIQVTGNAAVTLGNVSIDVSGSSNAIAFAIDDGVSVDLTLVGTSVLKSGANKAGLQVPDTASLSITANSTGSLETTGGNNGAGIGGGNNGAGGTITISGGTVTATGGNYGAGIGGGYYGAGGTITISGGTVTATGGNSGAGIGGGRYGNGGTITGLSGNAVIFASSIAPTLTAGTNATQAIVFVGNTGTMYSNVTLRQDVTVPPDTTLIIPSGGTLTIPPDRTLMNNGTIYADHGAAISGTVAGIQPVVPALTITGGASYPYPERVITSTGSGTYTIGMKSGVTKTTSDRIVVASGVSADITLNGVNIDISGQPGTAAFDMSGAAVNLTLTGTNVLKSGSSRAGLFAPNGSTLVIIAASTGSLTATGGNGGAGIGGGWSGDGGTITISGGTVTATGGNGGAGIGGGNGGDGGTITISGGTVTATGGDYGAGIGGGGSIDIGFVVYGDGGTITISDGTVTATGGDYGAGIGGGNYGDGATITIGGGTVTATGGNRGAGIGGGREGNGGTITGLSGNAVVFASSIQPTITAGTNATQAIVFVGNTGTMYSNVTLRQDVTTPPDTTLTIPSGGTLTIPPDRTLTNNGTIYVDHDAAIVGTVAGTQPLVPALTVTGGASYTYTGHVLTITGSGTYTIGMKSGVIKTTSDRIVVASGVSADITLNGVNIDVSGTNTAAFDMSGAAVNLTLTGTNVLKSGSNKAGLLAPNGSTLVITAASTGSLTATGGSDGAGIGGGIRGAGGTITISGGTVTATGGSDGAGIGGGSRDGYNGDYGDGGTITISGGTVTATGGSDGAGIGGGGGGYGDGGTITISGGTVTAIGGNSGAGIGGGGGYGGDGDGGVAGTITVAGHAVVFASSIQPTLTAGDNVTQAIVFKGNTGTMYGYVTLQQDITIPVDYTLNLFGRTLTIPDGITLTNNGTINKDGGTIVGMPGGSGSIYN